MEIICDCGKTMSLNTYEPDQDREYVGFDCSNCKASLYGTLKRGEEDKNNQKNIVKIDNGFYVVKIDDSFVEVEYKLIGSDEYSIQDLINIITENTKLTASTPQATK